MRKHLVTFAIITTTLFIPPIMFLLLKKKQRSFKILSPNMILLSLILTLLCSISITSLLVSEVSYSKYIMIIDDAYLISINIIPELLLLIHILRMIRILNIFKIESEINSGIFSKENELKTTNNYLNTYNTNKDDDSNKKDNVSNTNKDALLNDDYYKYKLSSCSYSSNDSNNSSFIYKKSSVSCSSSNFFNKYYFYKERYYLVFVCCILILIILQISVISVLNQYSINSNSKSTNINYYELIFPAWIDYKIHSFSSSYFPFKLIFLSIDFLLISTAVIVLIKFIIKQVGFLTKYKLKQEPIINSITTIAIILIIKGSRILLGDSDNESQDTKASQLILYSIVTIFSLLTLSSFFLIINIEEFSFDSMVCKELAMDFNLLMLSEKGYSYFYNYLKQEKKLEGQRLLEFYVECVLVKSNYQINSVSGLNQIKYNLVLNSRKANYDSNNVNDNLHNNSTDTKSTDINSLRKYNLNNNMSSNVNSNNSEAKYNCINLYNKFIDINSKSYIDFPSNTVSSIHKAYTICSKSNYIKEWDSLLSYCYSELKNEYFILFKESIMFIQLLKELEKEEDVINKLIIASVIDE